MPSDPADIAALAVVLLLGLAWHEAAHAWVADKLGDPTARRLGRVTLNPIKHLDFMMSLVLPVAILVASGGKFAFGGGKPVPIDVRNFRHRARDFMLVAVAGPFSNLVLAGAWALVFVVAAWMGWIDAGPVIENPYRAASSVTPVPSLGSEPSGWLGNLLWLGVLLNLLLALFNLVPIPPLDGSRVVGWLLPRPLQPGWYRLDRLGFILVLALIWFVDGVTWLWYVLVPLFSVYVLATDSLIALDPLGTYP